MPGGKWKFHQNLNTNTHQVEWPTGPLTVAGPNEKAKWVEAWVVQRDDGKIPIFGGGIGASQKTAQWGTFAPGEWTADGIPPGWKRGDFHAGPALGIALVASYDSTSHTDAFYWWLDVVNLR